MMTGSTEGDKESPQSVEDDEDSTHIDVSK